LSTAQKEEQMAMHDKISGIAGDAKYYRAMGIFASTVKGAAIGFVAGLIVKGVRAGYQMATN